MIEPDRRDDFALQMEYVARLGKLIAPHALNLLEDVVVFTGNDPYMAEELAGLLPAQVECYEDYEAPRGTQFTMVVVGQSDFSRDLIQSILDSSHPSPSFLPQEGFLDKLLFGYDWWHEGDGEWLNAALRYHPGLQFVKSLETFPWPGMEAEETMGTDSGDAELQEQSRLYQLGYNTNVGRATRWHILTTKAVPELGLRKVASMIAWFCRSRKQQKGGRQKFARAIREWEHDLARLQRDLYPKHRSGFAWPRSEP